MSGCTEPVLATIPIDDRARDGRFHLVLAGIEFAIARYAGDGRWLFATDHPLPREPESYHQPEPIQT